MSDEASNILRRFIRVVTQLDPTYLRYLTVSARSLHPFDLQQLATEVHKANVRRAHEGGLVATVIRPGDPPRVKHLTPVAELRGLAKSIRKYGGPDAVRRDSDPALVEAVNRNGWNP